jgi:hypothetical protein
VAAIVTAVLVTAPASVGVPAARLQPAQDNAKAAADEIIDGEGIERLRVTGVGFQESKALASAIDNQLKP